ncbi:aminotransferase A [Radiobacillus kanasensis]|uniref:aminotransferase A n=1 Tax=Radiobacillus kanasensis TaxID=2844358 RepID=UPI001E401844|nr:aminotransferase A [Radiobacillus kanasensis]UFU00864.1 aminotransferase A [Radiobacillus kanasensis]
MKLAINNHVENIEISGIRKFYNMVSGQENVLSLTIGQPDFETPTHVKQAGITAIQDNHTVYTPNAGILSLRQAIHTFVRDKYALTYSSEKEIIVTVGASQAIDITLRTILSPGDEVLLPGPVYPGYEPLIRLAGGIPVHVDTTNHQFKLTRELIKEHITDKTKCVLLPYPSNPTGATLSELELREIADELKNRDIFVLSDEIYSELVYEGKHCSIASFPGMRDKTIVINGLSKSHSMTGWRIGFILAPEWLASHLIKVHQYNVSCAASVSQYAALEALSNGMDDAIPMREQYLRRRDYCYNRLKKMGLELELPSGAFYLFPKIPTGGKAVFDVAIDIVDKAHLAVVPGSAFSVLGEGYVRISYAYSMETLEEGLNRLETYFQSYL